MNNWRQSGVPLFVAALFAWHPLHVESVAWVSERKDVPSACFWLLTLFAYGKYAEESRPASGLGSENLFRRLAALFRAHAGPLCAGLAFQTHVLVSLPLILLLLDYWPLRRIQFPFSAADAKALLLEKIPFFLLAAASCVITFLVQKQGKAVDSLAVLPLGDRIANALVSYVRYLGKLFWPAKLAILYPHTRHLPMAEVLAAAILLLVICAVVGC